MINGITTQTNNSSSDGKSSSTTNAANMQDQFLALLVAQLKNQDPMNPMDNAQMTSQMAQISTVSGIEKLNDTVQSVTSQFASMQMLQGASLIGRTVLAEGNTLGVTVQEPENGSKTITGTAAFDLANVASDVTITITDASGKLVDTMELGTASMGRNYFTWDGSAYEGDTSNLRFKVNAKNGESAVTATPLSPNAVIATSIANGSLMLELGNGSTINYNSIKAIF